MTSYLKLDDDLIAEIEYNHKCPLTLTFVHSKTEEDNTFTIQITDHTERTDIRYNNIKEAEEYIKGVFKDIVVTSEVIAIRFLEDSYHRSYAFKLESHQLHSLNLHISNLPRLTFPKWEQLWSFLMPLDLNDLPF